MAKERNIHDPLDYQFRFACPGCGQPYLLWGVQVQQMEEMACDDCNSTFRIQVENGQLKTELVTGPTGSRLGPAEGPIRR